jgi:UTP--glucose-1-phosphate uridylyltransferase
MPKEMLPVVDKPLIQYAVEEAQAAGIEEFIFVTGRGKTAIEDHFDNSYELADMLRARKRQDLIEAINHWLPEAGQVAYTRQQDPLGLGHAVWCARNLVGDEPFAVLLADDLILANPPTLKQMVDRYADLGGNIVAVMDVPRAETRSYGILDVGREDGDVAEVVGLVEKPDPDAAPSTLSIIGRYILQPAVFKHLGEGDFGTGGEIQLTDALAKLIGNEPFHGFRFRGRRFDCGSKIGFIQANIAFALQHEELGERLRSYLRDLSRNL